MDCLLEQRHEPVVTTGTGPENPSAVADCGSGEVLSQSHATRDFGGFHERALCRAALACPRAGISQCEQKLTARRVVLE